MKRHASTLLIWLILTLCCILPVAWVVVIVLSNRASLVELKLDSFRIHLIARTIGYNVIVAIVATLIAIPAAVVLGRGRGILSRLLWFVLPISLLIPSLTFTYGWKQALRLIGFDDIAPAGFVDVSRCIWSLATWLWPVPAVVMGLSLRRMDVSVQQQAQLDGGIFRVMLRHLIAPAIASIAIVAALAMQEFSVYEPTGISVIATETRMVFETGAFSSPDNPITQPITGLRDRVAGIDEANPIPDTRYPVPALPDQPARSAAAVATCLPMLAAVALLSVIAFVGVRRVSSAETIEFGAWPGSLDARFRTIALAWIIVVIAMVVPITALFLSHKRAIDPAFIWGEFGPEVIGSIIIASITGAIVLVLALLAAIKPNRSALMISLISFLIGGQLIAIALIRLYNRNGLIWLYESAVPVMMAYIARFGWIVLLAALGTFSAPWKSLRDVAALDGATRSATARHIIWPLAWPTLGASALFVATLSLSEVPATVLLAPQRPQVLVPLMMTWVHALRSDPMIEASLVTAALVVVIGIIATSLSAIGLRTARQLALIALPLILLIAGCDPASKPDEIWLESGTAHGQVAYPRGLAYSRTDDTFFIVDRAAHIQHLDARGKFLNDWKMPLSQQGKPVGLTVGPNGNLYVPDTHYHRVLVYSPQGALLKEFGSRGTGPGQFIYPTDIAFDSKGNIFVSEYGDNDRIQVFDRELKFLHSFGKFGNREGEFSRPQSMVIDGDFVYITDACNHRLVVFKTDGTFVRNMGKVGTGPGEFRFPYGLDIDKDGDLIVCEFGNNRVQKIDKETGKSKGLWGRAGRQPGELAYPWGVCVDKHDRVVAVDAGNNRVQVFEF